MSLFRQQSRVVVFRFTLPLPQGNVHVEKRTVSMNTVSIKSTSVNGIS